MGRPDGDDPHPTGDGAGDDAELNRPGGQVQLRFTRRFRQSPERVWRALSEPEHLAAWFPTTIEGERSPGAPLRFAFTDLEAPSFDGEMLAFVPPSLMALRWGDEVLRFELAADGAGSILVFTTIF